MKKLNTIILIIAVFTLKAQYANAQLTGFESVYFQDQYLANPAMAGLDKGLNLNMGFQQQWTSVPGSPKLENLTAAYNAGNRVGLGLNINNDVAGLIRRTRVMGTYAYHLPLNGNDDKLNFGLSLGINDTYIDYNQIIADPGDVSAQNFNQRGSYVDGDLGISYTSDKLNVQAALPNLKSVFFASDAESLDVDRSTFYTAVSYKIPMKNDFSIEPKLAFRGVKGFDDIFDAGFNLAATAYHVNLMGMYHTNQSVTIGLGLNLDTMGVMLSYTNNTGQLNPYANNTFELGLSYKFWNK